MPSHTHAAIMTKTLCDPGACGKAPPRRSHHKCIIAACTAPSASSTVRVPASARRVIVHVALAMSLAGCIVVPNGSNGRWVGPVTPVSGTCDPASQAVLLVSPAEATFAPDDGVLLLRGHADDHGHVSADLRSTGFNHQTYLLTFTGELQDDRIVGTFITPRCRATVTLHRG